MLVRSEIIKHYLWLPTKCEIRSALLKAFYDGSIELQVFVLNQNAFVAKQNDKSCSNYYKKLT